MSDFKVSGSDAAGSDSDATPMWRDRRIQIAMAVLGAIVLCAGGYFLLFAGGEDDGGGAVAQAPRTGATSSAPGGAQGAAGGSAPTTTATPSAVPPGTTVPARYDEPFVRDPFAVLYPAKPEKTTAPDDAAADPAVPTTAPVAPGTVGGGAAPAPSTPVVSSQTVSLKLLKVIDDDTARISIDGGPAETVRVGVVFAEVFTLASTRADEGEASFRFGDGDRVTLRKGETATFVVRSA